MIDQKQIEKTIKRIDTLLKSQAIYNYMLELMDVRSFMIKRLPLKRKKRELYDKIRPEIRSKDARKSMQLSLQIQAKEKAELLSLLKNNSLSRYQATMHVLIDYGVYVNVTNFERNLRKINTPQPYKCTSQQSMVKVPADKIKDYTTY